MFGICQARQRSSNLPSDGILHATLGASVPAVCAAANPRVGLGGSAGAWVAEGGFLGMGNKLFAVPWQPLKLDTVN